MGSLNRARFPKSRGPRTPKNPKSAKRPGKSKPQLGASFGPGGFLFTPTQNNITKR